MEGALGLLLDHKAILQIVIQKTGIIIVVSLISELVVIKLVGVEMWKPVIRIQAIQAIPVREVKEAEDGYV